MSWLLDKLRDDIWTFVGVLVAATGVIITVVGILVGIWLTRGGSNTNEVRSASPERGYTKEATPFPSFTSSTTPLSSITPPPVRVSPSVSPSSYVATPLPTQIVRKAPTVTDNDVGKSKENGFYEITIENAWTSTKPVRMECHVDVPNGQKSVFVRFAIRTVNLRNRSAEEQFHLGGVSPSAFVVIDDWKKRVDPACQNLGILVGENANTKTLVYIVSADADRLIFRFQKVGAGDPLIFDLSDLD